MFKNLLIFICISLPFASFAQSKALVDSINKVIGPVYVLDVDTLPPYHSYNSFDEVDLTGDGVKEIVIAAAKTNSTDGVDSNKIFVLERKDMQLHIIDSSPAYEMDGRGPSIRVDGLNLAVTHTFHHGLNEITFQFNRQLKKYTLVTAVYSEVAPNSPKQGQYTSILQEYNVEEHLLSQSSTVGSYGDEKKEKTKDKKISKKLPQTILLNLSDMKDPSDYDDVFRNGVHFKFSLMERISKLGYKTQ